MSIKSEAVIHEPLKTFPILRKLKNGPTVVLFITETEGVVLQDSELKHRVGMCESWLSCFDTAIWAPCTITLTSEN